jgi:hypothetical protein
MKKILIFLILTYLSLTINSISKAKAKNILEIGVLLPLSGEFKYIGDSFLKAIQLGLHDISNKNIKIYPKDSKANAIDAYKAAKEFQEQGIKIVIGPIFFESLEKLNNFNNITFISFTNKTEQISDNIVSFGININSQINIIEEYFNKNNISKTLFLSPKSEFINQTEKIKKSKIKFHNTFKYNTSPKMITGEIQKLTKYQERKKDLERRINILEKSDLYKDKQELKRLEQIHTLGKVSFDSIIVLDFGERLKSVLTSFIFSDVTSNKIKFFTINQWFDETFFNESALENLHFPAVNLANFKKFNKKYSTTFNEKANQVAILAYDALGLIYYCWYNNNFMFEKSQLYNKKGFKGLHGNFIIKNNLTKQKLKIYKVSNKKFVKVY